MKLALILLGLVVLAAARPDSLEDSIEIEHDIDDDGVVTGSYSFTDPEGNRQFVRYIADDKGYRILESNVVPATLDNVRADGNQGSFTSFESDEDK
ncbi:unnamed protein product [Meganyctiphanes norvegica]|uniref:Uncharacterized protein n=1 Tax=Meganyctiphanes norvegica TaxID=48144 RepID=A0AAV2RDE9_MEGNR